MIRDMRYEKFEKKRQELILIVKNARASLLDQISHTADGAMNGLSKHQSSPDLRASSQFSSAKSKMLFENIVTDSHRENYDKIVQKAKEREINLMNKMLKNEETKNTRYEQQEVQKEAMEQRLSIIERKRQLVFKKQQEEKMRLDFERREALKREEQRQRLEAQEKMREDMERQKLEEEKTEQRERERQREMQEKEQKRKEKAEKAAQMRDQEMIQQGIKLEYMAKKLHERERIIRLKSEELKRRAQQRRQQFETIKEKVKYNLELEEQKKLEDFLERKQRKDEQEAKMRFSKLMQIEEIKQKVCDLS